MLWELATNLTIFNQEIMSKLKKSSHFSAFVTSGDIFFNRAGPKEDLSEESGGRIRKSEV